MLSTLFYILAAPLAFSQVAGSNLVGRQTTPAGPLLLHPDGDVNKCLDVRGGMFVNGTPVQMYVAIAIPRSPIAHRSLPLFSYPFDNSFDCNNSPAQKWAISDGNTKVQVFGTNFCLDAGSSKRRAQLYPRDFLKRMFFHRAALSPSKRCWNEDLGMLRQPSCPSVVLPW